MAKRIPYFGCCFGIFSSLMVLGCLLPQFLCAQTQLLPLDHHLTDQLGKTIYSRTNGIHSSIQPYELRDFACGDNIDSVISLGLHDNATYGNWLHRKIFNEHLVDVASDEYHLYGDFLPDLKVGRDLKDYRSILLNTRGFAIAGSVTKNFSFSTEFYENQAKFPSYIDAFVRRYNVVPGQGGQRYYDAASFDFAYSSAVISYRPSQFLGIQGGQGKNFIGDGYRSMLLSDAAFNYPFLKLTADIWKLKYLCMWAEFQDITKERDGDRFPQDKKGGVFHFLDVHVTDLISLGLFEGIIWLPQDSTSRRGIEWNYLNPIIFLRPVEYSLGSPDNVVMGLNWRYLASGRTALYGQVLIDEMTVSKYVENTGYWANKYAIQAGVKSFEPANIAGLFVQTEVNLASPYTYSHKISLKNYGHYNQSLAHPLGANFYESVSIAQFRTGRFDIRGQVNIAQYGDDSSSISFGKDIYKSYDMRISNYGTYNGQGVKTDLFFADLRISYVLNPLTNLRFELGAVYRRLATQITLQESICLSIGLRSSFRNLYYDM